MSEKCELLRHTLATLAYRSSKVLRNAPQGFAETRVSATTRSAGEILAHIGDLLDWALTSVRGNPAWSETKPQSWDAEIVRFFRAVANLDQALAKSDASNITVERLFQGPIADALTHVGQLATLRRLAGSPIRGENYFLAEITIGRVGSDQPAPVREFD